MFITISHADENNEPGLSFSQMIHLIRNIPFFPLDNLFQDNIHLTIPFDVLQIAKTGKYEEHSSPFNWYLGAIKL